MKDKKPCDWPRKEAENQSRGKSKQLAAKSPKSKTKDNIETLGGDSLLEVIQRNNIKLERSIDSTKSEIVEVVLTQIKTLKNVALVRELTDQVDELIQGLGEGRSSAFLQTS